MEMSQLLQYVHKIAPQEIHTFGKGSSSVGLTAYVTRDQETKQFMLEYDTLVLSDGGVCYWLVWQDGRFYAISFARNDGITDCLSGQKRY